MRQTDNLKRKDPASQFCKKDKTNSETEIDEEDQEISSSSIIANDSTRNTQTKN